MCLPSSSSFGTTPSNNKNITNSDTAAIPASVPSDPISRAAFQYALEHLHPLILNHSLRVYLLAHSLASREQDTTWTGEDRIPLLFTACILHDIGTSPAHDGPDWRFEIEGADAAVSLLRSHGVEEGHMHEVWVAIALHSTPQIAERIAPLSRLVRLAVTMDFKRPASLALTSADEVERVEGEFPRGEIEKVLADAVVEQAVRRPEKAPAGCWPGGLLRAHWEDPGWKGVNKAF